MTYDQELQFSRSLTALMPYAKGYARTLVGPAHHYGSLYEDFAQTAVLKAWENRHSFVSGTNLKAWLFTILRNTIVSHHRRHWREVVTDKVSDMQTADPTADPERSMSAKQSLERMELLTPAHQDVLTEVGWNGLSYKHVARQQRVPTGTIKSRVARARALLTQLASGDELRYGRKISRHAKLAGASTGASH